MMDPVEEADIQDSEDLSYSVHCIAFFECVKTRSMHSLVCLPEGT